MTPAQGRVARSLLVDGPATPTELAERLSITPAAVRRHIDALVERGYAVGGDRPAYGRAPDRGKGRPPRIFSLTEEGRGVFDQAYDDLALAALDFLARRVGSSAVADFAADRARGIEERYADIINIEGADPRERAEALARALSNDGYAANVVEDGVGTGIQVCQHNCPIAHVAEQHPVLCEEETSAMQRLLGVNVTRLATIAHGDGVCTSWVTTAQPGQLSSTAESPSAVESPGTLEAPTGEQREDGPTVTRQRTALDVTSKDARSQASPGPGRGTR